jgi:hypothetical protein
LVLGYKLSGNLLAARLSGGQSAGKKVDGCGEREREGKVTCFVALKNVIYKLPVARPHGTLRFAFCASAFLFESNEKVVMHRCWKIIESACG